MPLVDYSARPLATDLGWQSVGKDRQVKLVALVFWVLVAVFVGLGIRTGYGNPREVHKKGDKYDHKYL